MTMLAAGLDLGSLVCPWNWNSLQDGVGLASSPSVAAGQGTPCPPADGGRVRFGDVDDITLSQPRFNSARRDCKCSGVSLSSGLRATVATLRPST